MLLFAVWTSPSTICVITARLDHNEHYVDVVSQFSSGVGAWCMPAASPINSHGLLEEDSVANFVTLPSYHEDEAILEIPLKILAALHRRRDKYALCWRQGVSVEGPLQGSKLQVRQVTVSLGTIIFLLASFMWSQRRGVACSLRASFARVSQQFRFRVRLHLHCPFFGGPLNPTSLFLQQVTSTSPFWITCARSEALEGTKLDSSFRLPVGVRPCYFRRYQVLAQLGLPPEKQDCTFLQRR